MAKKLALTYSTTTASLSSKHVRFFDPFLCIEEASRNNEVRYAAIGYDGEGRLLYVVHIEFEEAYIRIISARKATTAERKRYDS